MRIRKSKTRTVDEEIAYYQNALDTCEKQPHLSDEKTMEYYDRMLMRWIIVSLGFDVIECEYIDEKKENTDVKVFVDSNGVCDGM